ncbi:MAG: hypothetical protein WC307_06975, partial [Candidatus Nanoarchaeia archaeon]
MPEIVMTGHEITDTDVINVLGLLDQGLAIDNKQRNSERAKGTFHPSEVGKCIRALYYSMSGEKGDELGIQQIRVFDNGNYAHVRLANYLDKAGVLVGAEIPVNDEELGITGHADAVILTEGKRILLDFKTIRSYPFKLTKEGKKDLDRTYLYQMTIYI